MATTPASRRRRGRRGRRGRRRRRRRLRRGRRRRQGTVPRRGLAAKPGPTAAATVDVGAGPAMHAASAPAAAGNIVVVVPAPKGQSRAATCRRRGGSRRYRCQRRQRRPRRAGAERPGRHRVRANRHHRVQLAADRAHVNGHGSAGDFVRLAFAERRPKFRRDLARALIMDVDAIRHQPQVIVRARATLKRVEPVNRIVHAVRAARRVVAAKGHVDVTVVVGEAVPR